MITWPCVLSFRGVLGIGPMRKFAVLVGVVLTLSACREVRVHQIATGRTEVGFAAGNQIVILRDRRALENLDIHAHVDFRHEFAVVLLMGPHRASGFEPLVESIRANADRVRVVAFDRPPLDGGEPIAPYRTYTLWIVPNDVYRSGSHVEVVTPSGEAIAETVLR